MAASKVVGRGSQRARWEPRRKCEPKRHLTRLTNGHTLGGKHERLDGHEIAAGGVGAAPGVEWLERMSLSSQLALKWLARRCHDVETLEATRANRCQQLVRSQPAH